MRKITNLWKFGLNWSLKLQAKNERKVLLTHNAKEVVPAEFISPAQVVANKKDSSFQEKFFLVKLYGF